MSSRAHRSIALLACLTVAVYARVVTYGYVHDDLNWLLAPIDWHWPHWSRLPWLLSQLAGTPGAFHAFVLGLHLLNGLLLYRLAQRWMSSGSALLVLTLFWLHPLQVEAVAYVTGGIEVLLTTYVLLAITAGLSGKPWGLTLGFGWLALAASVKLSALPLLLAVPAVWVRGRGAVPWKLLTAVGVTAILLAGPAVLVWGARASLSDRVHSVNTLTARLWASLGAVVWPVGLSIEHDPRTVAGAAGGWLALGAVAWAWRLPALGAAWLWITTLLLPRALVASPQASPLTEHHLYLPFLAIWLLAGLTVDAVRVRWEGVPCLNSTS